ncbi:hypothetical protein BJV77DRAFT_230354 [Russula vinacea]|nr:hypothetical protein BJV77DRAFT_230354 [Russula vinacea]
MLRRQLCQLLNVDRQNYSPSPKDGLDGALSVCQCNNHGTRGQPVANENTLVWLNVGGNTDRRVRAVPITEYSHRNGQCGRRLEDGASSKDEGITEWPDCWQSIHSMGRNGSDFGMASERRERLRAQDGFIAFISWSWTRRIVMHVMAQIVE